MKDTSPSSQLMTTVPFLYTVSASLRFKSPVPMPTRNAASAATQEFVEGEPPRALYRPTTVSAKLFAFVFSPMAVLYSPEAVVPSPMAVPYPPEAVVLEPS